MPEELDEAATALSATRSPIVSRWNRAKSPFSNFYLWLLGYIPPDHPCYDKHTQPPDLVFSNTDEGIKHTIRTYDVLRGEIKREDDLINQRITWCILPSAGILATVGAVALKAGPGIHIPDWGVAAFGSVLILAGVFTAYYCGVAVTAARMQIEYLFCMYYRNQGAFTRLGLPRPFGRQDVHKSGVGYSQKTPLIMMHLWLFILVAWLIYSVPRWT